MLDQIILILGILLFLFFIYFAIVSYFEKEFLASKRAFLIAPITFLPFILLYQIQFPYKQEIQLIFIISILLTLIVFTIPNNSKVLANGIPKSKVDERDIMFSRNELEVGTNNFEEYYGRKPENKIPDDKFRSEPGLLNPNSFYYDQKMAASAHSSFEVVDLFAPYITGKVAKRNKEFDAHEITHYLKGWTKKLGAVDVGFTELKDYHFYSVGGRGKNYGKEIKNQHKYAVAFTVEMDYDMVKGGPSFPIVMESAQQYLNAGQIAVQVAAFLRNLGYDARAHIDANYQVVCPLVAKDAGLGEIGRMGLLMTEKLGPRVRLGVVTTEIPLISNTKADTSSVIDFCSKCKKCADCCPSNAIPTHERSEIDGVLRWQINSEECFTMWCKAGSDCGRCVAVCPYSHPDNFLHNIIRWGIKRNSFFRSFALYMDDFFYGRKPEASRIPDWIN